MGREVPTDLQPLLDLPSCETQTTLDLYLTDSSEYHIATKALASIDIGTDTVDYDPELRTADVIKQSVNSATDRVSARIQNVDKVFGGVAAAEDLTHAVAVVGRYYYDDKGVVTPPIWVELFRGEAFPTSIDEQELTLEIINDLAACGYCVADWTLAEACQFIFKDADTCGYSGGETLCNKKRKSPAGCIGRSNDHHFGGMEFPEFQLASPGGDDTGDTGGGGGHITCPRVDMWVPVKGSGDAIDLKRAGNVTTDDETFNPRTGLFERVKSAVLVSDEPIWCIRTVIGGVTVSGYSSWTHPVFPFREHLNGVRVSEMFNGDPLVVWKRQERLRIDDRVASSYSTGELGDVMRIETIGDHAYAYGDNEDIFIECHNSKSIEGSD